jgi:hypothetical protein
MDAFDFFVLKKYWLSCIPFQILYGLVTMGEDPTWFFKFFMDWSMVTMERTPTWFSLEARALVLLEPVLLLASRPWQRVEAVDDGFRKGRAAKGANEPVF